MGKEYNDFRKAIEKELRSLNSPNMQDVRSVFKSEIRKLVKVGVVSLGPDYLLGGDALEFRVLDIFSKMGFQVEKGPPGLHDAIIRPFQDLKPKKPIVVETKSGKEHGPSREDLRQLDDWVFELSGEEKARKEGLGGVAAMTTWGYGATVQTHPTPHKGVMVFNGPVDQPFESRSKRWVNRNEEEFARKRDFCIISLECLVSWYDGYHRDNSIVQDLWSRMHSTCGVLQPPDT